MHLPFRPSGKGGMMNQRCEFCGDDLFTVEEQEAGICDNPECQDEKRAR